MTDQNAQLKLSFYDHHRQSYGHLLIDKAAQFMVGDYDDEGGTGGEFKITLDRLHSLGRPALHPHLEVFGDSIGSLRAAIAAGLLEQLGAVNTRDDFSRRLIDLGFRDRSDRPIGSPSPICPCCGQPTH